MQAFSTDNTWNKILADIFSKFVWIIPLNRKTGQEVENAFSRILKEWRPSKMWVEKGREFYNKDVQKLVELYSTEIEEKSCVIERLNRTIKKKMFRYFSARKYKKICWCTVLTCRSVKYCNSFINMTPKEASRKENENKVWINLYPEMSGKT